MLNAPTGGGFLVGARGGRLVEAEAGYVGGLDDVGVVVALFGEGDGEVLYAVGCAKFHQEFEEFFEMFDVVVFAFVGFDIAQEDDVVWEIVRAVSMVQNDNCC